MNHNISIAEEEFLIDEIIDKRNDGNTEYYYVRRKAALGDIYAWEPKEKLTCAHNIIEKFENEFKKKKKSKKKLYKKSYPQPEKRKKRIREKVFPCLACVKDSPWDPNRSLRGSLCNFS